MNIFKEEILWWFGSQFENLKDFVTLVLLLQFFFQQTFLSRIVMALELFNAYI